MDAKVELALVQELDPSRGGCPFNVFLAQTPDILRKPPYKMFDTVAIPLYSSPEHRQISLRHVLKALGATSPRATRSRKLKRPTRSLVSSRVVSIEAAAVMESDTTLVAPFDPEGSDGDASAM